MFREDLLHNYNPESIAEDITAIATPRTWFKASKQIEGIDFEKENYAILENYIGMWVGASIGKELLDFVKISRNYNIAEIYKTKTVQVPTETSERYALIAAITNYYEKKQDVETAEALLELIFQFDDEHAILILKNVLSINKSFILDLGKVPSAAKNLSKASQKFVKLLGFYN
jgi:hypothetical protein